jgi:hypothetical protein
MPKLGEKKKKKKAQKQKQKQKQIVKTNVKVNVQSSGGSGGGGTPSFIPQMFRDTSGENQRLVSLVEQIAARVPRQAAAAEPPVYNPANDASTRNAVFNAPINLNVPEQVGGVKLKQVRQRKPQKITVIKQTATGSVEQPAEMSEAIARAKLKAMEAEADMPFYETERFNPANDDETLDYIFNQPNTNNNSISDRIFTSNLQKKDPIAFENNRDEIQSVISGVSDVSETPLITRQKQLKSTLADIQQRKKELAGLAVLGEYQRIKAEETFIKAGASPEQIAKISKPFFTGEEEASFIMPSSSSSSSNPSIMSALGSEPMSLEGLMKSGALSTPSSVAPSSKSSVNPSSVAPSSKSSVNPSKVSTNLFKQIDDLNAQIKQETAKEKTLIGEPAKKQFDIVNTLIEKKLALQEQAGKPKTTMVEKAMKADAPKMTMVEKAAAPFGRFKNGNPRKTPSV